MNNPTTNRIIEEAAGSIDIPDSAYEKAITRYKDLGEWFAREDARCYAFNPHIYPQGSFRLGTVTRPVNEDEEYDLDMGCRLSSGITKKTHTQKQLKGLVGADLEDYRIARRIKSAKEEKHRCWRLKYADTLKFHLDAVPSIPETSERKWLIQENIERAGVPAELSNVLADLTGAITDNRMWNYQIIDNDWFISNSEGFAIWFMSRMKLAKSLMESLMLKYRVAKIDDLPAYRWKTPLQRSVQLLKRHRDIYFDDDTEGKPPSIIITTLSAMAYRGETLIADALENILSTMESLINPTSPRVPNPVNPAEDFADRWSHPECQHLNLEVKFRRWIQRAKIDFGNMGRERKVNNIVELAKDNLGISFKREELITKIGIDRNGGLLKSAAVPAGLNFPDKPIVPNKPAGFAI